MPSIVNLKAVGLNFSPSPLDCPDGSMLEASNVIIRRDSIVESRRGFKLYGDSFNTSNIRAKQLLQYKNRLILHHNSALMYDSDGIGTWKYFKTLTGANQTVSEVASGLRIKMVESNGNAYITTSDGIKKLSAFSTNDFTLSGFITQAGGVKAIDLEAHIKFIDGQLDGFLEVDHAVSYRVVWGMRDANNNVILGVPSQTVTVTYNPSDTLYSDYFRLLNAIDKVAPLPPVETSHIANPDANYEATLATGPGLVSGLLEINSTTATSDIYASMQKFVEKLDKDILLARDPTVLPAAPLQFAVGTPPTFLVTADVIKILFSNATDPTGYLATGAVNRVYIDGFTDQSGGIGQNQTFINGWWEIVDSGVDTGRGYIKVTKSSFDIGTYPTSGTLQLTGTIVSYNYRAFLDSELSGIGEYPDLLDLQAGIVNPTGSTQYAALLNLLQYIIDRLNIEPTTIVQSPLQLQYIAPLLVTRGVNVELVIKIPQDVTPDHFYQIYRTASVSPVSDGAIPDTEFYLIAEDFPTAQEFIDKVIIYEDINNAELILGNARLYTNPSVSGESQANDIPPVAKDLSKFKGSTFYANTRTRQKANISMLGVDNIIDAINLGQFPQLYISREGFPNQRYEFIKGAQQITNFTFVTNAVQPAGAGVVPTYVELYCSRDSFANPGEKYKYIFWFNEDNASAYTGPPAVIPAPPYYDISGFAADKVVQILLYTGFTLDQMTQAFREAVATQVLEFTTTLNLVTHIVGITDNNEGYTTNPTINNLVAPGNITFTIATSGKGEKIQKEIAQVTFTGVPVGGEWFKINTAYDEDQYAVWYSVVGVGTAPVGTNRTLVNVDLAVLDDVTATANKTALALVALGTKFDATNVAGVLTVTNYNYGKCTDAVQGTTPITGSVIVTSQGALEVLTSTVGTPSQRLYATARSLNRLIDMNTRESIYSYFVSSIYDTSAKLYLEAKTLNATPFYLSSNNTAVGSSFFPSISFNQTITAINRNPSAGTTEITTLFSHNLTTGDKVFIGDTNSVPKLQGVYGIIVLTANKFSITTVVTVDGTTGYVTTPEEAMLSENETKANRIYYSKFLEPESVPMDNWIDVGAEDKEIIRIFPLRDSLFVFKSDGLYRISGESIPFNLALFDSSCNIIAPDSVDVTNNLIYGWTTQGVVAVSESGVNIVSRPIDTDVLPKAGTQFANFVSSTFGVGYDSDNSYIVFTTKDILDAIATMAYRYSNLTNSWTIYDMSATCGIKGFSDDRLYLGAGDINYIEQERKLFNRTDYSDREYTLILAPASYQAPKISFGSVTNIEKGDVLTQEQYVSVYNFNSLLQKLDVDSGVTDIDYYSTLMAVAGDNLRLKLEALALKLDADTGVADNDYASSIANKTGAITIISAANPTVITSVGHGLISGRYVLLAGTDSVEVIDGLWPVIVINANTFSVPTSVLNAGTTGTFVTVNNNFIDLKICFNKVISKLNLDTGVAFSTYQQIVDITLQEATISDVNKVTKVVTVDKALAFIQGPLTQFKAISSKIKFTPNTMQDVLSFKHLREATFMFLDKAFTGITAYFSSDLIPSETSVEFFGDGPGLFGHNSFGNNFFGGASHSAPFRTYVPRPNQRCRYLNLSLEHKAAREKFGLLGITVTGEILPTTRAYR